MALSGGVTLLLGIIIKLCILREASAVGYPFEKEPSFHTTNSRRGADLGKQVQLINGSDARIEDYPFVVSIIDRMVPVGQGSIIGIRWVLTAAHCFVNDYYSVTDLRSISIISNTSQVMGPYQIKRTLVAFHNHDQYDKKTRDYDISVVKVDSNFYGLYEKPVSFAAPDYYYKPLSAVRILGWNYYHLQSAVLYITPQSQCKRIYNNGTITPRKVCAHGWKQAACFCDDGGPMYQRGKIIGVLSSYTCDTYVISMNLFTRISEINGFILRTMNAG